MKKGSKKTVIGFKGPSGLIHVQVRGGVSGEKYTISRAFTIRLKHLVTEGQVEDLRDLLVEVAKDWYEQLSDE